MIQLGKPFPHRIHKLDLTGDVLQRSAFRNALKQVLNNLLVAHEKNVCARTLFFKT